jgi:hypothetical protein
MKIISWTEISFHLNEIRESAAISFQHWITHLVQNTTNISNIHMMRKPKFFKQVTSPIKKMWCPCTIKINCLTHKSMQKHRPQEVFKIISLLSCKLHGNQAMNYCHFIRHWQVKLPEKPPNNITSKKSWNTSKTKNVFNTTKDWHEI